MRNFGMILLAPVLLTAAPGFAMTEDDPLLATIMIRQLEVRDSGDENNPFVWDAQGWVGKDLNKLWLKTEGEVVDGDIEASETQVLYGRAIAPYWDAQIGWRRDLEPGPRRDWLAIGVQGVAPYFFETDVALFVGEGGDTALRVDAEYELMFTQRLILTPEVELNFYGRDDSERGIGSGLSDAEGSLRLRYEFVREFAPYVGVSWEQQYGRTANLTRARDEKTYHMWWTVGIRAWF